MRWLAALFLVLGAGALLWLSQRPPAVQEPPQRDIFRVLVDPSATFQPPPDQTAVTALVPPIPAPRLAGFILRDEDNETCQALVADSREEYGWSGRGSSAEPIECSESSWRTKRFFSLKKGASRRAA